MPLRCYKSPEEGCHVADRQLPHGWRQLIMLQRHVCCNCMMPECGLGVLRPMLMMCSYMLDKLGPPGGPSLAFGRRSEYSG